MAIRPLSFIGDRDAPTPLSAVHARRPILGSGKLPKDLVEIAKTRSYYVQAKDKPSATVEALGNGNERVWRVTVVEADALFNVWFGWPTGVTSSNYDAAYLGAIGAMSQTFFGPDTEATSVSDGVSLSTTMFAVPPNDVVVFEVALSLDCYNDDGNIDADFASGDFQIACPVVVFSLLNSPPGAMA